MSFKHLKTINTYIVYKHIRNDTNQVFYVGIGSNLSRSNSKNNRNVFWHRIVAKAKGYYVDIVDYGLTQSQACKLEVELIKQYGRRDKHQGSLCNLTDGGIGTRRLSNIIQPSDKLKTTVKPTQKISELHKQLDNLLNELPQYWHDGMNRSHTQPTH